MSSESEAAHAISPVADSNTTTGDDDMQLLNEAVRSLPSHAVKDLLSIGLFDKEVKQLARKLRVLLLEWTSSLVCTRCIFRLFGIRGRIYSSSSLLPSIICSILGEPTCTVKHAVNSSLKVDEDVKDPSIFKESEETEPELCRVCLGILQFIYCDDKGITVKKNSAINLALSIAELIKREGHQIDSFSLEVSIPQIILENEQIVHLYMKKKYRSELWFQERLSKCISAKDALKSAIANPLENLLDVKSAPGSCHIRLTYTQAKPSGTAPNVVEGGEGCKRRKTDTDADLESINDKLLEAGNECFDSSKAKGNVFSEIFFNGLEDHESSECVIFPRDKVNAPCHLVFLCYRTPIYFGGRYLKFSRNVSQTRWIIDDERMGETSIEEIIGGNILPMCQGDSYKFHAAGREDIDVRMLGSGRPFLVEIQNARLVPSESLVKEIETKINNFNTELVGVRNLKIVGNQGWNLMHEGEAEKQKQYCALVWISRPIEDQDLHSIINLKDLQILQRTPIRVLHRRSPLEREKIVHWMKIETIAESSQYFLLHLCTQAGTYIKEFVHGDLGRTHPNIGSILGCRAEILQLDVTGVKMDCFLAE